MVVQTPRQGGPGLCRGSERTVQIAQDAFQDAKKNRFKNLPKLGIHMPSYITTCDDTQKECNEFISVQFLPNAVLMCGKYGN